MGVILKAGRVRTLAGIGGLVALIAAADWYVGISASLGVFYIVPMVIGATVLRWPGLALLAVICSCFRSWFDVPAPLYEQLLRFSFATLAYVASGLLVAALIRNREMTIDHLANIRHEQELRREAEEQLRILVESSPAAVLTVDASGTVLAANGATNSLFMIPEGETMKGRAIGEYLPVLLDALQFNPGPEGLRTAAQSQGRRENDELFLANAWFSSYMAAEGKRLAAIVVDSSEEMRDREEESLHHLSEGNRIAISAVFHEVRNLSGAISVVSANLKKRHGIGEDEDFRTLLSLAGGLERVASVELRSRAEGRLDTVDLQGVLNDLRIVIEQDWRDIGGSVRWQIPRDTPPVLGVRYGLFQAFLNLAHNAHRAVRDCDVRELSVIVFAEENKVSIRFLDSGSGRFQAGASFRAVPIGVERDGTGVVRFPRRSEKLWG